MFEARRNHAIMCDGSVMPHGTDLFTVPDEHGHSPELPLINKDDKTELVFVGNSTWEMTSKGAVLATYNTNQLRISFVWRSRCFASEEQKQRFNTDVNTVTLEEALSKLVADLRRRYLLHGALPGCGVWGCHQFRDVGGL